MPQSTAFIYCGVTFTWDRWKHLEGSLALGSLSLEVPITWTSFPPLPMHAISIGGRDLGCRRKHHTCTSLPQTMSQLRRGQKLCPEGLATVMLILGPFRVGTGPYGQLASQTSLSFASVLHQCGWTSSSIWMVEVLYSARLITTAYSSS
jgi:hypothetical protein